MFDGKLDVHGRQDREDVCLQEGHEDLEAGHDEDSGTGQSGGSTQDGKLVQQHRCAEVGHAQQEVTGDHVAQESQRQRYGSNDEVGEELDRRDQQVHWHGQPGREKLGSEESSDALLSDTRTDEGYVGDDREDHGDCHHGGGRDVDAWNNASDVHGKDTKEQEADEAGELPSGRWSEHVESDVVADVPGDGFNGHLTARRHELRLTRNGNEHDAHEEPHDDAGQRQSVEFEERSLSKDYRWKKILQSGLVGMLSKRRIGGRADDEE